MHSTTVLAIILALAPALRPAQPDDPTAARPEQPLARVTIAAADPDTLAADLTWRGFDVLGARPDAGLVELIASDVELELLSRMDLAPIVVSRGRPLAETLGGGQLALGSLVPTGYPDLAAIELSLAASAAAHPGLARVVNLTQAYRTPTTFEGRNILAMVISDNVAVEEDEPTVLLVSNHHAREIVTPLVALEAIDSLLTGYGSDPAVTAAVDGHEIWIIPVQNPDGYAHVFTSDNNWRKNRRIFPAGIGVDLNRNYPAGWGDGCGGSTSVGSTTYEGPSPASEPETQTLIALSDDRRFAKVLDFHSSGLEARYGYGCWTHPLDSFLADEATAFSVAAGWGGDIGSSCCLAGEIHYQMRSGAHALLLETASSFQPSFADGQAEAEAVWSGIAFTLARDLSVTGHVHDAATLQPLDATLEVSGVSFTNGESFGSGGDFGRYHATLPNGSYTLTFSAPGYLSEMHPVTVSAGSPVELDVALSPLDNAWQNLAGGSPGNAGTPQLLGTGPLVANTPLTLDLSNAVPGVLLLGWTSVSSTPIPLAGGTLHAHPFLRQFLFLANGAGALNLATTWPPVVPVGTQLWVQFLCEDGTVVDGFTLSNALLGVTP